MPLPPTTSLPTSATTDPGPRAFPHPQTRRTSPPRHPDVRRALADAAPALLAYAAVRVVGLLVLTPWARSLHQGVWQMLATQWDSDWYLGIADHGYTHTVGTAYDANNLAFFPLYPMLVKAVAVLTPGTRATTALVIAVLGSFLAAWGIFAVGRRLYGRRVGVLLTVLWAALPVGLVQWMAYTESLFTAFVAWSLYAVLTRRWLCAAALAVLAGLTRPTGIALAAAVVVAALLAFRRDRTPRPLVAAALAPLGWVAYVGWVGLRLRRWDGYLAVQRMWHNEWNGGTGTLRRMRDLLVYESKPHLFLIVVALTLLTSLVLFGLCVGDRQPLPLLVFTGALLLIVLGSGGMFFPRARYLLPGFPLLLPLAVHLARASRRFLTLALTAAVLGGAYCGANMLLVWPSAP